LSGFIHSEVAGRTDRLPVVATADSFVVPADVVSGLGQGNSLAGAKILDQVLGPQRKMSSGGEVPIIVAGGEYRVEPESVKRLGGGDMERGHAMLRKMVLRVRKGTIKQLSKLPKPRR
jgi:hypothetical protein